MPECQSISYDAMSAWVSVVFARYVMPAYLNRLDGDERTAGELFYSVCDELADITLLEAFELLMRVWEEYVSEKMGLLEEDLSAMLEVFLTSLPAPLRNKLKLSA